MNNVWKELMLLFFFFFLMDEDAAVEFTFLFH